MHTSKRSFSTMVCFLILAVTIVATFFIKGARLLDPDFGYRLTTGQTILSQGFPRTDPYSYTMPSYPYVEHAWIIGVLWAALYPIIGKVGLAALASIFAIMPLVISARRYKPIINFSDHISGKINLGLFANFLFLLSISILYLFFGVRAQVFGWLVFAIFLNILLIPKIWEKWRLLVPFLFLFWANFHGSFAMGLLVLIAVTTINLLKKKADKIDITILIVSILITLFNPYGVGLWREAWSSMSDASLRYRISEWNPGITMLDVPMMMFLAFSLVFVIHQRLKISLVELVLFFGFTIAALVTRRNLPLWIIVSLPIATKAIDNFYLDIQKIKFGAQRFTVLYKIIWVIVLALVSFQILYNTVKMVRNKQDPFYPYEAVEFLIHDPPQENLFSSYGWGGYLIWKMPDRKVFIDGKMPSWRWKDNPDGELPDAFTTYIEMTIGKKSEADGHKYLYQEMFEKFNVSTVLWRTPEKISKLQELEESILSFFSRTKEEENIEEKFEFVDSLKKNGWVEIYTDDTAIILEKV